MKYAWIAAQGQTFALSEMCDALDVSISGYRAWKRGGKPDRKRLSDSQFYGFMRRFGYGQVSGSGFPGEAAGTIPSPGRPGWSGTTKQTMSYG